MGSKNREHEIMVARVLDDAGAVVHGWGIDGQTHRTVDFEVNGCRRTYRFPSTGKTNGHALPNARAQLKRLIKTTERGKTVMEVTTKVIPISRDLKLIVPERISKQRRRAIGQQYLRSDSIAALAEEVDMTEEDVIRIVKAERGLPLAKYRREQAEERQARKGTHKLFDSLMDALSDKKDTKNVEEGTRMAGKRKYEDYFKAAEEAVVGAVLKHHEGRPGFSLDIPCCADHVVVDAFSAPGRPDPEAIRKTLRGNGWVIGNTIKKTRCPEHAKRAVKAPPAPPPEPIVEVPVVEAPAAEVPAAPQRSEQDASYVALMQRYIRAATVNLIDDGVMVDLKCEVCGSKAAYAADTRTPPNRVLTQLREEGWKIGVNTDNHACPEHYTKPAYYRKNKKEQHAMPDAATQMRPAEDRLTSQPAAPVAAPVVTLVSDTSGEPMPQKSNTISPQARAARSEALGRLNECYDPHRNCYKSGFNDKVVAEEFGLHESVVADIREFAFGPMSAPIELIELTDKLAAIDERIADATRKMENAIADAKAAGMLAIGEVRREAETIRATFDQLAKQQGWVE